MQVNGASPAYVFCALRDCPILFCNWIQPLLLRRCVFRPGDVNFPGTVLYAPGLRVLVLRTLDRLSPNLRALNLLEPEALRRAGLRGAGGNNWRQVWYKRSLIERNLFGKSGWAYNWLAVMAACFSEVLRCPYSGESG